jgi:hypothetical protein
LDFPHPFGPTTPVIGSSNVKTVRSTKDLNPQISSRFILIELHLMPWHYVAILATS